MRILIIGTVAILIIPGLVKTIQDYEVTNDTNRQLSSNKDNNKVTRLNSFKNLYTKEFSPSDFP